MSRRRSRFAISTAVAVASLFALGATVALAKPMFGTSGNDTITGTDRHDYIAARAGDDTVNALGGFDVVFGGRGNDTVHGGAKADLILGGRNNDTLYGEDGNDRIFAQLGVDTEFGGEGNDDLWAMARHDVTREPNEPADTLDGGPGNDRFHVRDGEPDHVTCGEGVDVAIVDFKDVVSADCEVVKRHKPRKARHGRDERREERKDD